MTTTHPNAYHIPSYNNILYLLTVAVLYWGKRAIALKPQPCPQMCHETLFDEYKASAYRCKNERSVGFKISQNAFLAGALPGPHSGAHDALQNP